MPGRTSCVLVWCLLRPTLAWDAPSQRPSCCGVLSGRSCLRTGISLRSSDIAPLSAWRWRSSSCGTMGIRGRGASAQ
eukprot:12933399-Prorocentrum_lima.AAC.1